MDRYAGRMDLCEVRIAKEGSFFIYLPGCAAIGIHCIGGKEENVSVSAGGDDYGMAKMPLKLSADQVSCNDTPCLAINDHQVHHLPSGKELNGTFVNLFTQG